MSVFSAARHLCERSGWTLSNLKLQKILFLAHMVHLGEKGEPLIREGFEAWDYGPVSPDLYRRVRVFGSSPIRNIFHGDPPPRSQSRIETLDEIYDQVGNWTAGQLVRTTHRRNGAWDKAYIPGAMGVPISNEDILQEYQDRAAEQS
ncbi:Panacea domain-containing protein [Phenylobacterium sp.]